MMMKIGKITKNRNIIKRLQSSYPILKEELVSNAEELTAWRHDFHANPELGFEEFRTSALIAERMESWGIEVTTGIAKTGVVGVLKGKSDTSGKSIGIRADMDCLPMREENDFAHKSTVEDKMHACGHDGHSTILLGTAKYLAETRNFDGTVNFIFQPAEECLGGGRVMVEEGLFERFPCDRSVWTSQLARITLRKDLRHARSTHGSCTCFSFHTFAVTQQRKQQNHRKIRLR